MATIEVFGFTLEIILQLSNMEIYSQHYQNVFQSDVWSLWLTIYNQKIHINVLWKNLQNPVFGYFEMLHFFVIRIFCLFKKSNSTHECSGNKVFYLLNLKRTEATNSWCSCQAGCCCHNKGKLLLNIKSSQIIYCLPFLQNYN